jgi:hypothetical protein
MDGFKIPQLTGAVIGPSRITADGNIVVGLEHPMVVSGADRAWMDQVVRQYEQVQRARHLP